MPAISTSQLTQFAQQRFQQLQLPAGTDRPRFDGYLVGICRAIGSALETWRRAARLDGVRIHAVSAIGGKLISVALDPLILQAAPPGWEVYSRAIAAGVHNQFKSFGNDVTVPGLPWYPAFAAFPGPMAPPMPNAPTPLMTIASVASRHLKEGALTTAMFDKMPNPKPACGKELAMAVAAGLEKVVFMWLSSQMVSNVLGKGPIPTFAPPYVPVGPVVNGDILSTPGHIAA